MNYYKEIKEELINMRQFYIVSEKWQTLSAKLNWSHYVELLSFNDINEINYYINTTEKYKNIRGCSCHMKC